jgi:hypothetical protein
VNIYNSIQIKNNSIGYARLLIVFALVVIFRIGGYAQVDTSYYTVPKDDSLLILVDTLGESSTVDSIYACQFGTDYGMYELNSDSLIYNSSNVYGRDTLCTQVEYISGVIDSAIYVITVLPSTDTIAGQVPQNEILSYTNSSLEISEVDSFALCNDLYFGTVENLSASGFDYHSGFASGFDDGCLVVYGDQGISDTLYFPTQVTALDTPTLDIGEWFIDIDPGVGNGNIFTIGVSGDTEIDLNIPLEDVSNGLHTLFVRAKDDNGFWGFKQQHIFFKQIGTGLSGLAKAEWYIDEDPGVNNANQITLSGDTAIVDFNIDLSSVSNGLHTLFVRAQDGLGYWSVKQSHLFFKQQGGGVNDVAQMEYYIDVDPGYGNGNFLPASNDPEVDVTFNVDIDDLSAGLHTLYIRAKNSQNYWSFAAAHTFFKMFGVSNSPEVVALEYYIDNDPGIGNGVSVPIPQGDSVDYVVNLDLNGLNTGIHAVHFRAMSSNGFYSHVQSQTFFVVQGSTLNKQITHLEYFYNIDPGYGNALPISITPNDSIDITAPLSLSGLPEGTHDLYIRAKDENELWSLIYHETVEVTESDMAYPEIAFNPSGVSITAEDCFNPVTSDFYIKNTGQNPLTFNIDDETYWLSYSQETGSVEAADSVLVTITANPQGLTSAQQLVDVVINSNDAFSPDTTYSIVFNVPQSALSMEISEDSLMFDDTQVFTTSTESISIQNTSCTGLQIDSIKIDLADFVVSFNDTLIGEGEIVDLEVSVTPIVDGLFVEPMYIYSDAGVDTVYLEVLALEIPTISFSEVTIAFDFVACAESDMYDFQLYNTGLGPLFYEVDMTSLPSWFDIQVAVDTVGGGDSTLLTVILTDPELQNGVYDFDIPFISNDPSSPLTNLPMTITVDGMSEVAASVAVIEPEIIPRNTTNITTIDLQNIGCDNLSITSVNFGTTVFSSNVSSVFLPPYYDYPINITFSPPYAGTFVDTMTVVSDAGVLKVPTVAIASGAFTQEVQPLTLNRTIQACDGMTMDTLIVKNSGDGEGTWEITNSNTLPDWLYVATLSDTLAQGDSTIVEIGFDATGLINANYDALIQFQFSDPITPSIFIPIDMYVEGAAVASLSQDTIDFGYTYYTTYKAENVKIYNEGCDTLHIVGVDRPAVIMVSDTIFDVLPNDSIEVTITYDPNEINLDDGDIDFLATTDTLSIALLAEGVDIPRITTLNKDSLVITMPKDIDVTSLTDSTWVVWGDQTGRRFGDYSVQNGNEMVFEPNMEFRAGEELISTIYRIGDIVFDSYTLETQVPIWSETIGSFSFEATNVILNQSLGAQYPLDIDLDGDLDLIFDLGGSNIGVLVLYQNSNGEFGNEQIYSNSLPQSASIDQILDYNNDGFCDLVFSTTSYGKRVFLNNQTGGFGTQVSINTGSAGWKSKLVDLDLDNDYDVVYGRTAWLGNYGPGLYTDLNDGEDNFSDYQRSNVFANMSQIALADFDSDGYIDIVSTGTKPASTGSKKYISYHRNKKSYYQNYSNSQINSSGVLNQTALLDINGSGWKDVLFTYGNTYMVENNESNTPSGIGSIIANSVSPLIFGDVNGDGLKDYFTQNENVYFGFNSGSSFESGGQNFNLTNNYSQNLADLDNDGDLDFAFLDSDGRLWLAINEDSNAEMALSQDSIQALYISCAVDTTYNIEIYNYGDSTLIWQVSNTPLGAGGQSADFPTWLQIDTTYGQVPGSDSLTFPVHINTNGLASGDYAYDLIWNTNDTTSYHDTLHIAFTLESDSTVTISETNLDYGLVDTMSTVSLDLMLHNFGCDTLDVTGVFDDGIVYSCVDISAQLYPFDSLEISVVLDANDIVNFIDTLRLDYEYGTFNISLSAQGCYTSPVTEIFEQVCDVDSVGVDSLMLMNVSGCDSLVITYNELPNTAPTNGLVAYYPFNGNANDESGNGNNGVVYGSTLSSDRNGIPNSSYYFDGSNDYIEIQHSPSLALTDELTLSAWINFEVGGTNNPRIFSKEVSNPYAYEIWTQGLGNSREIYFQKGNNGVYNNIKTNVVQAGSWHLITATYDGSTMKLYLDDDLIISESDSQGLDNTETTSLWIGQRRANGLDDFKGYIDDIRIYNRSLALDEIKDIYDGASSYGSVLTQACQPSDVGIDTTTLANANQYGCDSTIIEITSLQTPISPEGLVAYYPFDGNAEDMSGYENDGVVNGATLTKDRFGNVDGAYSFDGVNDWININQLLNEVSMISDFSFSTWFKTSDVPIENNQNIILCGNDEIPSTANLIRIGTSTNGGIFFSPSSNTHYVVGSGYNDSQWHHLSFNITNNNAEVFIDGQLVGGQSNFNVSWSGIEELSIGQDYDNSSLTDFYNGELDEIIFTRRGLSTTEIQALYQEGASKYRTNATTCDITEVGTDTSILTNQHGCDSTIIEITSLQTPISPEGLVAYYPFDGNAEDMSGYENDGVVNGATLTEDRFGNVDGAYSFDGNDDFIEIPDSLLGEEWTFSSWVLLHNLNKRHTIYGEFNSDFHTKNFIANKDDGSGLTYDNYLPSGDPGTQAPNSSGIWQNLTVSKSANTLSYYLDGSFVDSEVFENYIGNPTLSAAIGARLSTSGVLFQPELYALDGSLDDVFLFNRALTPSEIQQLYLQSKAPNTTIATQDTLLDFGTVDIGDTTYVQTYITNTTCDTLYPSLSNSTSEFQIVNAGDTILPYRSMVVDLAFHTDSIAIYSDTLLAVASGDTVSIALSATAIGQAEIALSKAEFTDTLYACDAISTDSFYVYNTGSDPLNFDITFDASAISVVPVSGNVVEGDSILVSITIDGSGLENGSYLDSLVINSDDATDPVVIYDITYTLDGLADKSVSNNVFDFGTLVAGASSTLSFDISNAGCDSIQIVSMTNQLPEFTASISELNVPPFTTRSIDVTYTSTSQMMIMDSLVLVTDYGNDTIILTASACEPSPEQYLITDICDESLQSSDTTFFTNQYGCDSLIINNSLLPTQVDDSEAEIILAFDGNADDSSPNGYNGSLTGASYATDRLGNPNSAIACDGFFDYATTSGTNGLVMDTNSFALSVWIKTSASAQQTILSKTNIGTENYLSLELNNGQAVFELTDPSETQNVISTISTLSDDEWHHILVSRNDAGLEMYIDGTLDYTQSYTDQVALDVSGEFHLGILQSWTDGTLSQSFDGAIDNFRFFTGIPSTQNISRLVADGQDHINTTTLFEQVCDIDSVGVDTSFLQNGYGCDSLVVTYYELPNAAPTNGLIAYYPFNGNANDESGNGNDGTVNSAVLTQDRFGVENKAYSIENNQWIDVQGLVGEFETGEPFSLSIWYNSTNASGVNHGNIMFSATQNVASFQNIFRVGLTSSGAIYLAASDETESILGSALDDGEWHHLALVHNGANQLQVFNDNEVVSTLTDFPLNWDAAIFYDIGQDQDNTNQTDFFNGLLDDIHLYNRELSSTEIANIFESATNLAYSEVLIADCDPVAVGTDTTLLTNQYGCDSTIIEITSLQTPISPEGLVAYYPFDGNAEDMSGYENDGVVNGATLTEDRFGNVDAAYSFDGVDDMISTQNVSSVNLSNSFTINGWIKAQEARNQFRLLLSKGQKVSGHYEVYIDINTGKLAFYSPDLSPAIVTSNIVVDDNVWKYFTITYEGSNLDFYIDSELIESIPATGSISELDDIILIGEQAHAGQDFPFLGSLDEISILGRKLSSSEIQQLYLQSKAPNTIITSRDTLLDFETITLGDTSMINTWITNATCDTISINSITTSQGVFWTDQASTTILPYQSNEIAVSFSPQAEVPYLADLTYIVDNVDTVTVELKGNGCTLCACPTEDVVLNTQMDIDDYISEYGGCDTIIVNFTIDEISSITDISGLDFLSQIDGNVNVRNTTTITDLSGFANLQDVTGTLTIRENDAIASLSGLNRLKQSGTLTITQNDALATVAGIDSLTLVAGNLTVTNNINLTDCSPLCSLLSPPTGGSGGQGDGVGGSVAISGNPSECSTLNEVQIRCADGCPEGNFVLTSQAEVDAFVETFSTLSGAEACDSVIGNLTIDGDDIANLTGLSFIQVITGTLTLKNNPSLNSVSGLQNLSTVGNQLIIENNAVADIDSLSGLASVISHMTIRNNPSLQNVNGLVSLETIDGNLIVTNNTSLNDCSGLCTLISEAVPPSGGQGVAGQITIAGNPSECSSLTEVTIRCNEGSCPDFDVTLRNQIEVDAYVATFNQCDSIFGSLTIQGGNSIQDITGLSFIQYVGGSLIFKNNYDLDSISGLDSVQYVGGDFKIENNHELQDISQMMMLSHIGGELSVYNNDMLPNLIGLDSITYIGQDVRVQHNAVLSDCSVLCMFLDLPPLGPGQTDLGVGGSFFVNNNPAPCSNLDQVEAICTYGSLISEIYIQNLQDTIVEGNSLIFDIAVDYAPSDTLIINLTSNNALEVPLPLEVMILPDSIKTTVAIDLPDDGDAEENEVVTITAGAQYLQSASDQFVFTNDDDIPGIALEITQDTISEAAGLYATTAKVIRLGTSTEVLNITLSSSSTELNIPTGVNIFANESEKTFFIGVFDNAQVEGLRQATVTASYIIPSCVCPAPSSSEGVKVESIIIADNDGPTLELSVNPLSMEEGKENAGTLTIKRNTDTSIPLDVNISVSDATEIMLPSVVTIPVGQSQMSIPIETLNDPLEDGNQEVTISANASGFTGGDVWVIVTDINKPDLIIPEVTVEQDSIDSEVLFPFNVKIHNKGLSSSTQGVNLIGYLSTNSTIDANDHVIGTYFLDISVASGDTIDYPGLGTSLEAPGNYKLLFRINPEQSITELLYLNNTSSPIDITIRPEYSGTVAVADSVFLISDEIVLTGSSYNNEGVKRPNTPLEIFIYQGQVRRNIQVTTDINGDYSYTHYPLMSEYGHFEVGIGYPGLGERDIQDEYDVLGVEVNNGNFIIWNMDLGDTLNAGLSIRNVTEVDMEDVTLAPINLPNGCELVFDTLPMLAGNQVQNIPYEIVAGEVTQAGVYQEFPIEVYTENTKLQDNTGYYVVNSLIGSMQASIASINTTINQNTPQVKEFTITNVGQGETGPITVSLPNNDWIRLISPAQIPSLSNGASAIVSIEFVPTDNLPLNTPASGTIAINADNANGLGIPFSIQKVSDETGGVTVDVIDQFTYFTEEAPHVDSARVRISNYFTGEVFADGLTGADGTITFDSLPEGQLRIVVDAYKHKSYDGVIDVSPGVSFTEVIFLEYQAISFTWDVVPTTIDDEYDITLIMNFETNAPLPVVVIKVPPELPDLDAGETFAFNIVMTNEGLITAQDVQLDLPDDPEYEFMTNYEPQDILAQQTIQVPVVMKLRSGSNAARNSEDVIEEANRRLNIKN